MGFFDIQESGSVIDHEEWNDGMAQIQADWADLATHIADTDVHTTAADEANWNWAYQSIKDSGNEWYAAYKHSANAKNLFAGSSQVRSRFKASSGIWVFASSQKLSGQLLTIRSSRDINNWSNTTWHNSSLMWNKDLAKWIPKPSSAAGGGGDLTRAIADGLYKPSSGIWNYASSQKLSGQLLAIHSARDINAWNASYWHNSGLMWNNTIGKWVPHKSGASIGDSGTPAGGDKYVQFNQADSFGGKPAFTWNYNTSSLRISGAISGTKISGGTIRSNSIIGPVLSQFAGSSSVRFRFPGSSTAISRFADSSNIRYRFKSSSNVWIFASSQKISGQLLALYRARDINVWNSSSWNNSGLIWDSSLNKWKAKASSSSSGVDEFTELTDVPNSYSGKAGKFPIVNETETGLVFADIVIANVSTKTVYESNVTEGPQIVFTTDGVVFA